MDPPADNQPGPGLTRRRALGLLGAAGSLILPACSSNDAGRYTSTSAAPEASTSTGGAVPGTPAGPAGGAQAVPACVVRPAQTEGPYFVDEKLNRSDIRPDPSDGTVRPGTPLRLTFSVGRVAGGACTALAGAMVDVWHCDAAGVYSDTRDPGFDTAGRKFLRGYQLTDGAGRASFLTVYPGWYRGRAVHVHFKIRNGPGAPNGFDFTSQLYFDEGVTGEVFSQAPYAAHGSGWLRNRDDGIYRSGGAPLTLAPERDGQGWAATFDIGVQA